MFDIHSILTALLSFALGAFVMFVVQFGKQPSKRTSRNPSLSVEEEEEYPPFPPCRFEVGKASQTSENSHLFDEHLQQELTDLQPPQDIMSNRTAGSSRTRSISFDSKDLTNSSCTTTEIPNGHPTLRLSPILHPKLTSDLETLRLLDEVNITSDVIPIPTRTTQVKKKNEKVKALEISPLENEHALKSNFWRPMIMSNLGEKISFCPQELSYRFSQRRDKIHFDGCWRCGDDEPFIVVNRIINYENGQVDCILFDFSLNDYTVDRELSVTSKTKEDMIVWKCDSNDKATMTWRRYTILDAMRKELLSQKIRLPPLCFQLVQSFVGPKVWVPWQHRPLHRRKSLFCDERNKEVEKGLRRFRLKTVEDFQKMKERLLNMENFSQEQLRRLFQIIPHDYEVEKVIEKTLKQCKCKTDRWFRVMATIPNLERRMSVWLFTLQFPKKLLSCYDTLKVLDRSYQSISENKSLKLMFALILSVCNYMNEGTAWGGIYGFKLDTLKKLSECHGNQESLLFYIVLIAHQKHPGSLRFVHELSILSNASSICDGFGEVECNVAFMGDKFQRISSELDSASYDEVFADYVEEFLDQNSQKYAELASSFDSTVNNFKQFGLDLGESELRLRSRDFSYIEDLDIFRKEVQKVMAKISETKEIQERKMEVAKRWKVQRKRLGSVNSQSSEDSEQHEFVRVKERLDRKRRRKQKQRRHEEYLSNIIGKSLQNEEIKLSQIPFNLGQDEECLLDFN